MYSGKRLIIREGFSGVLAASQKIVLYEAHFPLVKKLGEADLGSETLRQIEINSIIGYRKIVDTIIVKSEPDHRTFEFRK